MRTLNVSEGAYEKIRHIKATRPQDSSIAETFDHILSIYKGVTKTGNVKP